MTRWLIAKKIPTRMAQLSRTWGTHKHRRPGPNPWSRANAFGFQCQILARLAATPPIPSPKVPLSRQLSTMVHPRFPSLT